MQFTQKVLVFLLFVGTVHAGDPVPTNTDFVYQGQLKRLGRPVTDVCDFQFELHPTDAPPSTRIGPDLAPSGVAVENGLFSVTLDFGSDPFSGDPLWLEIRVRCGDATKFDTLLPRVRVSASPYSLQTRGLFVDSDQRVGIGTTTPQRSLHVVGDGIRVDGTAGVTIPNPNNLGATMTLNWLDDVPRLRLGGTGVGNTAGFHIQGTADKSLLRILDSGKVGIGTTEPAAAIPNAKLEVAAGHIAVSNNFGVFSNNAAGNAIGAGFDTTPTDDLALYAGGGSRMTIMADGEIRIPPKTRRLALSAADFEGTTGCFFNAQSSGSNAWPFWFCSSSTGSVYAPVHLPQGAKLNGFQAFLFEVDPTSDWTVRLVRLDLPSLTSDILAEATTTGTPGISSVAAQVAPEFQVVDTSFTYWLYAAAGAGDGTTRAVNGAWIDYTIESPLP